MNGSDKIADQQKGVIVLSKLIEMKNNRLMVPDNPEIPLHWRRKWAAWELHRAVILISRLAAQFLKPHMVRHRS